MTCYSDDGEPITREWLVEEYGTTAFAMNNGGICVEFLSANPLLVTDCELCDHATYRDLPHIRTRGDLRRLLAALGWRREG